MNEEEFGSDSDSSDEDFCPEKIEKSDSDEIDEKDEALVDEPDEDGSKRKGRKQKRGKAKTKENSKVTKEVPAEDPEAAKKREDELWAAFLGETDTPPAPKPSTASFKPTVEKNNIPKEPKPSPKVQEAAVNIFEFAGEQVVVEQQNVLQNSSQNSSTTSTSQVSVGVKRSGGGLSSVLGQIAKKNKLSVLQKTKIDWEGFKSNAGINEEIQTHNRGREG